MILQKITELGLSELTAFASQFTVVKENTKRLERLDKIAENASRQCGRANTVKINEVVKVKDLPSLLKDYDLTLLAYEKGGKSLKETFEKKAYNKVAIIVGSEGGFAEGEVEYLQAEVKNLVVVGLGKRILRAETASIVLSSLVMHELGELNG